MWQQSDRGLERLYRLPVLGGRGRDVAPGEPGRDPGRQLRHRVERRFSGQRQRLHEVAAVLGGQVPLVHRQRQVEQMACPPGVVVGHGGDRPLGAADRLVQITLISQALIADAKREREIVLGGLIEAVAGGHLIGALPADLHRAVEVSGLPGPFIPLDQRATQRGQVGHPHERPVRRPSSKENLFEGVDRLIQVRKILGTRIPAEQHRAQLAQAQHAVSGMTTRDADRLPAGVERLVQVGQVAGAVVSRPQCAAQLGQQAASARVSDGLGPCRIPTDLNRVIQITVAAQPLIPAAQRHDQVRGVLGPLRFPGTCPHGLPQQLDALVQCLHITGAVKALQE